MRQVFSLVLSLAVGVLFVRSSIAHLSNPYFFLSSIYGYKIVGPDFGFALALVIPFVQLVVVCCLLARTFVSASFSLAAFLFATYSVAQASALWRGLNIQCGCFGSTASNPINAGTLSMVIGLFFGCALASYWARSDGEAVLATRRSL